MSVKWLTLGKNRIDPNSGVRLDSLVNLRPAGLEPATDGLENRCSIRLSYGRIDRSETR